MKNLNSVLIVGGGIAGMTSAIRFAEEGASVTLIDIDPEWRVYGAGITITGVTLRAYKRLDERIAKLLALDEDALPSAEWRAAVSAIGRESEGATGG